MIVSSESITAAGACAYSFGFSTPEPLLVDFPQTSSSTEGSRRRGEPPVIRRITAKQPTRFPNALVHASTGEPSIGKRLHLALDCDDDDENHVGLQKVCDLPSFLPLNKVTFSTTQPCPTSSDSQQFKESFMSFQSCRTPAVSPCSLNAMAVERDDPRSPTDTVMMDEDSPVMVTRCILSPYSLLITRAHRPFSMEGTIPRSESTCSSPVSSATELSPRLNPSAFYRSLPHPSEAMCTL